MPRNALALIQTTGPPNVKGIGSTYWRVIGTVEEMMEKAKALKQCCLRGINFARMLERKPG